MKLVTTKFKSGGLHEKHVVATWDLGNHLSISVQYKCIQQFPYFPADRMRSHFSCSKNKFENVPTAPPPLLQLCHSPQHAETNALNKWYKNVIQASLQRLFVSPSATLSVEQDMPDALTQRHTGLYAQQHLLYRGAEKSLARPGRKQARKHVRDARDFNNIETRAVINFFSCKARRRRKFTPFWQKH